jgi:hypothetical protein
MMEELCLEQSEHENNPTKVERIVIIIRRIIEGLDPHTAGKNLSESPNRFL